MRQFVGVISSFVQVFAIALVFIIAMVFTIAMMTYAAADLKADILHLAEAACLQLLLYLLVLILAFRNLPALWSYFLSSLTRSYVNNCWYVAE